MGNRSRNGHVSSSLMSSSSVTSSVIILLEFESAAFPGPPPDRRGARALLAAMDDNGNELVEFDELAAAIAPLLTTQTHLVDQAQLLEVFQAFDRDGNRFISAAELARSMARLGQPLMFEKLTRMMRDADADGDGVISFKEFAAVMAKSVLEFLSIA